MLNDNTTNNLTPLTAGQLMKILEDIPSDDILEVSVVIGDVNGVSLYENHRVVGVNSYDGHFALYIEKGGDAE